MRLTGYFLPDFARFPAGWGALRLNPGQGRGQSRPLWPPMLEKRQADSGPCPPAQAGGFAAPGALRGGAGIGQGHRPARAIARVAGANCGIAPCIRRELT